MRKFREKENYKSLRLLEEDISKDKRKTFKIVRRMIKKLLETKLSGRNLIKEIDACHVPIGKWTTEKLR